MRKRHARKRRAQALAAGGETPRRENAVANPQLASRWLLAGAVIASASAFSCFGRNAFLCSDDAECNRGSDGRCEATGYCSYPGTDCDSGRRYDGLAGEGLAGKCVDPEGSTQGTTTGDECLTCVDLDEDGYGVGAGCLGTDCDDRNPARSEGCLYLAPGGIDEGPGTAEKPWGTFAHALTKLAAGDSLVLLDGEYRVDTTGLPNIDCGVGGNAPVGTQASPISLTAANARRAYLRSNGSAYALRLSNCEYWSLSDLAGRSDDFPDHEGVPVEIVDSHHIEARGLLFSHPNRHWKSPVYRIWKSSDVLVADSEAYTFHRAGVGVLYSDRVVLRRMYINAGNHEDLPGSSQGLTTGIAMSGDDNLVENVIVEGVRAAGINFTGSRTRVLGSVVIDSPGYGIFSGPAAMGLGVSGTRLENVVIDGGADIGIYLQTQVNGSMHNVTVMNSVNTGVLVREALGERGTTCASIGGCSFEARHILALDNGGWGFSGLDPVQWIVSYSNAWGNGDGAPTAQYNAEEPMDDSEGHVQNSLSEPAHDIGRGSDQCIVFVPEKSPMHGLGLDGQDIGANILYRYENGVLTEEPLWDPETGAFPCGVPVAKVNDDSSPSCSSVHERLNVNVNGCELPELAPVSACRPS